MDEYADDFADDGQPFISPSPPPSPPSSQPTITATTSTTSLQNKLEILESSLKDSDQSLQQSNRTLQTSHETLTASLLKANNKIKSLTSKSDENSLSLKLYETSERLVNEGQRNVKLSQTLHSTKQLLVDSNAEKSHFRNILFSGINGGVSDKDNYANVSLADLLRLRLQESDSRGDSRSDGRNNEERRGLSMTETLTKGNDYSDVGGGGGGDDGDNDSPSNANANGNDAYSNSNSNSNIGITGVQKLEYEIDEITKKNQKLHLKCTSMEDKLSSTLASVSSFHLLKQKFHALLERSKYDKDMRSRAEMSMTLSNRKVEALSDHIEKLMLHLKHEATSKARAFDESSKSSREVELLRLRNTAITKKNAGRDRVIVELKEGAKILEDQLRLMDEKYMELRTKLDWTRLTSDKVVRKKEEEAKSLRTKFALVQGSFSGGAILDSLEIGEDGKLKTTGGGEMKRNMREKNNQRKMKNSSSMSAAELMMK